MLINISNTIEDIYIVGDVHSQWNLVINKIRQYNIRNSIFIFCGDIGIGFERLRHYTDHVIPQLYKILKKFNCIFIWIRGNHSDPKYYENQLINTDYIKCVPDYSIINVCGLNILAIGGAISVDRMLRKNNDSIAVVRYMKYHNCNYKTAIENIIPTYWENEQIAYKPKVNEHIDIICSHSAPSFCYPLTKGEIVTEYAKYDPSLIKDIETERSILNKVFEDYKDQITHWYYGHFHQSNIQIIDNITFKLLNIGEICRHVIPSNNDIL